MLICEATVEDTDTVCHIERQAFGRETEERLVRDLLQDPSAEPRLSLIATRDGADVGHILYTKAWLEGVAKPVEVSFLAPLAVLPAWQNQGVGSALAVKSLTMLRTRGVGLVFLVGHPAYYPRFGFRPAYPLGFEPPYPIAREHADAWMVAALDDSLAGTITGKVRCADTLMNPEIWRG